MSSNSVFNVSSSPVDIHDAMEEVREQGEIQSDEEIEMLNELPKPLRDFLDGLQEGAQNILNFISELLRNIFPEAPMPEGNDGLELFVILEWIAKGIAIAVVALLLYFLFRAGKRAWDARQENMVPVIRTFEGETLTSSRKHREQAQNLAKEGQYEQAVRQLYLSMLCLLDETRVIPFETNRTNMEYIRRIQTLSNRPTDFKDFLRQRFSPLARTFEGIRYGNRTTDAGGYKDCHQHLDQLIATLETEATGHVQ